MPRTNLVVTVMKMKQGDPGLPRRKVCIRAVHHLFVSNLDKGCDGESEQDIPP